MKDIKIETHNWIIVTKQKWVCKSSHCAKIILIMIIVTSFSSMRRQFTFSKRYNVAETFHIQACGAWLRSSRYHYQGLAKDASSGTEGIWTHAGHLFEILAAGVEQLTRHGQDHGIPIQFYRHLISRQLGNSLWLALSVERIEHRA